MAGRVRVSHVNTDLIRTTIFLITLIVIIIMIRNSMIKMFVFMSEHEAVQSDTFSPQLLM